MKRDKLEEKSHRKQDLTMNGSPEWPLPTIKPSLERTTSVSSNDNVDDIRETEIDNINPPVKKSGEVLPYNKGVSEQIRKSV